MYLYFANIYFTFPRFYTLVFYFINFVKIFLREITFSLFNNILFKLRYFSRSERKGPVRSNWLDKRANKRPPFFFYSMRILLYRLRKGALTGSYKIFDFIIIGKDFLKVGPL